MLKKLLVRYKDRSKDSKYFFSNKYRSETITQPKSNNLHYMINPAFRNINTIQMEGGGTKGPLPTSFFPVTSTITGISFNCLTFSFNPFATLA